METTSINTVGGALGAWTTATSLPEALGYSQAVVTSNRVYLLGVSGSNQTSTVYTAPINEGWYSRSLDYRLPVYLEFKVGSQAIVTSNRVYLLGGINGSVSTVYTAPINEDGTLGAWTTATSLPGSFRYSQAVVTSNRVYLLGGRSGMYLLFTLPLPINKMVLGAWTTAPSLPGSFKFSSCNINQCIC